jgi:hypothetical protein
MLATKYNELDVSESEWRVLHRIGSRDPAGIRRAMKKYKVDNIQDLVAVLEHHQPERKVSQRALNAIGRLIGGYGYNPHDRELKLAFRQNFDDVDYVTIKARIRKAKQYHDG